MITILITLLIVGVMLYVFNNVVPIDGRIRIIINAIVVVAVCIWVLQSFGFIHGYRWR